MESTYICRAASLLPSGGGAPARRCAANGCRLLVDPRRAGAFGGAPRGENALVAGDAAGRADQVRLHVERWLTRPADGTAIDAVRTQLRRLQRVAQVARQHVVDEVAGE